MIQWFLRDNEDEIRNSIHLAPRSLMNSMEASFIRQFVSFYAPDLRSRTRAIQSYVDEILNVDKNLREEQERENDKEVLDLVTALYKIILNRGPDGLGLAYYTDLTKHLGISAGAQRLVADALQSDEYKQLSQALAS